jgi:molecular chaperone DnaK
VQFEKLITDLIDRSIRPCERAMRDAKLSPSDIDEVILVGGSTRVPAVIDAVRKLFGKEPNRSVNPDEAVALGAAIQGGVLSGDVSDIVLLDVTPLSLGIETLGGVMTVLIPSNTTIPGRKEETFSTASDNQRTVDVHVLQGERPMAIDNKTIGRFQLDGIPPAPRGMPQIVVTFDIDANGILSVTAKDKATGKEQHIKIQASSGLSKEEVEKMKSDAKSHADEDKKRRDEVDVRNRADQLLWQTEKQVAEMSDKLEPEEKGRIQTAIERLKEEQKGSNIDGLKSATEDLEKAWSEIVTKVYQRMPQDGGAGAGPTGHPGEEAGERPKGKKEGEVENADYEVVE